MLVCSSALLVGSNALVHVTLFEFSGGAHRGRTETTVSLDGVALLLSAHFVGMETVHFKYPSMQTMVGHYPSPASS